MTEEGGHKEKRLDGETVTGTKNYSSVSGGLAEEKFYRVRCRHPVIVNYF